MSKSTVAIVILSILLVIVSCFVVWVLFFYPLNNAGINNPRVPVSSPGPVIPGDGEGSAGELEAQRLEAERQEAERLEAERIEAELRELELSARREIILEEGRLLLRGYFYEEALELLNADESLTNHETQDLESEVITQMNSLIRYDGDLKHIFFHSLILYPENLFPNLNTPTGGYNEGFIYQSELIRLLPQLLERGYVLYNINDIFSKNENGEMKKNDIYLPPGKMPLVISMDDPSYHYNKTTPNKYGFANRVVFDEFGEIATEVPTPSGEILITYDGDVHVVIDSFVKEHPEFSFRGHKGAIASTGYMGIFGYDLDDLKDDEIRQEVIAICDKFKENGWIFANHSYTHNRRGFWGPDSNPNNIRYDVRRWKEFIEPIVGQTNLFIAPFGYLLRGEGMQVILDNGYDIYCTVDFNQPHTVHSTHAVMGRIEIGGYSLARYTNTLNRDFFDVASVKDSHRPPVLSG